MKKRIHQNQKRIDDNVLIVGAVSNRFEKEVGSV